MTPLVPELSTLPVAATLDGELVAFGPDGSPDFPLLCERRLMRRRGFAVTDGEALFEAVCAHELEGVVAKRRYSHYRPGERGWVKTKNRSYWRYELERESALNKPRVKRFV